MVYYPRKAANLQAEANDINLKPLNASSLLVQILYCTNLLVKSTAVVKVLQSRNVFHMSKLIFY